MSDKKSLKKTNQELEKENERVYREILSKEMLNKVRRKIEEDNPDVLKTIKILLDEDQKKEKARVKPKK